MMSKAARAVAKLHEAQSLEIERLEAAIAAPILAHSPGSHHIAVLNSKGGTGKTTVSAIMGLILASIRGEIAAAVCSNGSAGTLRRRLVPDSVPPPLSFVDLCYLAEDPTIAAEWATLAPYTDVASRLRVLSNHTADPKAVGELLGEEYHGGIALLRRAAQLVISDMGTSFTAGPAVAALESANSLVFATNLVQDSLELTLELVSALAGQPKSYRTDPDDYSAVSNGRFASLVRGSVVVISPSLDEEHSPSDLGRLTELVEWLRSVCQGGVFFIPKDPHVGRGDLLSLRALQAETLISYLGVVAAVAARFPLVDES